MKPNESNPNKGAKESNSKFIKNSVNNKANARPVNSAQRKSGGGRSK